MERVRIGCVQYLNTLPLIEGLRTWCGCEVVEAVPSALIGMLRRGEVDVALASVVDANRANGAQGTNGANQGNGGVTILPVGMIGSDGPTLTVRVFSRVPIEKITRVAADTDSHTSVALLRVVMKQTYGIDVETVAFDASRDDRTDLPSAISDNGSIDARASRWHGWPEAVLLIGDKVVTDPPPEGEYPHQLDLGEAWKELTGLPFVYAVWMCRAGEEESAKVKAAAAMLDRARRHNATRLDWIVAARAESKHWPRDLAAKYVGELMQYEVGEREREAVGRFLEMVQIGQMGHMGQRS